MLSCIVDLILIVSLLKNRNIGIGPIFLERPVRLRLCQFIYWPSLQRRIVRCYCASLLLEWIVVELRK
jgi:hypothetical protein